MHYPIAYLLFGIFILDFLGFLRWAIMRNRRWERFQQEAASRSKAAVADMANSKQHMEESLAISKEQLQITRDLITEIKALRNDLKNK